MSVKDHVLSCATGACTGAIAGAATAAGVDAGIAGAASIFSAVSGAELKLGTAFLGAVLGASGSLYLLDQYEQAALEEPTTPATVSTIEGNCASLASYLPESTEGENAMEIVLPDGCQVTLQP